ncbi:hypothetical protein HLH33_13730 [Gluconacetobacter diazotrophicus]|uniref:Uncharacterized protein n=1 Tax=Gluconacetobacter diazotrophicus TaxID=33996 RepID=A0A7W4I6U7_GLUDI|nr:hypothetical protein [Gluconacetobacter diazotrophicus]MBB2157359.1 hypothetical protein [Gluconacetobacter diazotrophicus]
MTVGLQCPVLLRPPLTAAGLTATKWAGVDDKARGGNALLGFIARGMPRSAFSKTLYRMVSNMFGFIACYDLHGFWDTHLATTSDRAAFLEQIEKYPCWGQPAFTWSDVERRIGGRIRDAGLVAAYRAEVKKESLRSERDQLARLLARHGHPGGDGRPAAAIVPSMDPASRQFGLW